MEEEKIRQFIKENLKIHLDFDEEFVRRGDMRCLVVTLTLGGETISEKRLLI